ncbi:MAG TPA: FAD-binding oxidoreductase [Solirubrobacteraceae bacterium]|jgi:FAD/FMN-containing dehydrogenase|nr:FAD-binding oxidoreductase [Solirubrobacteraceae bacterium]
MDRRALRRRQGAEHVRGGSLNARSREYATRIAAPDTTATLDRRRFLRQGAAAMAALTVPALAGCGGGSSPRRASRTVLRSTSGGLTEGVIIEKVPIDWRPLAKSLSGRLVLPSDHGYATARELYDPRFDRIRPAAVAYCASPADVQKTVDFARSHGIRPIPRGGGHSYGGYSTGTGLVIDVTRMGSVTVTPARKGAPATAAVGAGARLVDFYDGLARANVLVPGGSCPTVGISGLALGGGIGVLARKYGLTSDAIRSLEVVTADGRLLRCSGAGHADLYWASRGGGGGNFGVVTSFTFTAHPIPSQLTLFTVHWPWAAADEALGGWIDWLRGAPDEVWSNFQLLSAGSSGLVAKSTGVFVGSKGALTALVNKLVASVGAAPSSTFVGGPDPYLHLMLVEGGCDGKSVAQCHLRSQNRAGMLQRSAYAAKSAYVGKPLPSAGLAAAVGAVEELHSEHPGLGGGLVCDAYGGAVNRVPSGATAFVHRGTICGIQMTVTWGSAPSGPAFAAGEAWLGSAAHAFAPFTTGGAYQNYIDPRLSNWQHAYYGSNLGRLTSVKRKYDPDNAFRFAQSIPLHA